MAEKTQVKTFPAPEELATPTDLSPDEAQAVTEAVNPLIADTFALYTKTKNFHWHLSGSHFRDYHLLLDEHAEQILATVDPMSERVRKIGGTTIRSISHISELQSIEDDNEEYVHPGEMLRRLIEDNRHIVQKVRSAHEVADGCRDYKTSDVLEDVLEGAEERMWFLYETSKGENNTA
ncbi:Dps family protein [Rubrobacter aplysinae]|uniref:Dps family protein n=1 Tax=Rubrobacter aplysinae TaxID=909625 RepID=UPI00064C1D73|nr:DNA starvation/stationary phase protection protein [Rubrobacter aplysinae]